MALCKLISDKDPKKMKMGEIRRELNRLLFDEKEQERLGATEKELLTLTPLVRSQDKFRFLQGFTRKGALGKWTDMEEGKATETYSDEANAQIDIEFKEVPKAKTDQPQNPCAERVSTRAIVLLKEYYKRIEPKEELLYARSMDVDESTL